MASGRSNWGGKGGRVPTLTVKNLPKIGKRGEKSGKIGKKEENPGRKGKNRESYFTLPLLTDRAGYATAYVKVCIFFFFFWIKALVSIPL